MALGTTTQPALADKLRPEVEDQRRLTALLSDSTDPMTRLLVHISQRQLDLFEVFVYNRSNTERLLEAIQTDLGEIRRAVGLPEKERPGLQLVGLAGNTQGDGGLRHRGE